MSIPLLYSRCSRPAEISPNSNDQRFGTWRTERTTFFVRHLVGKCGDIMLYFWSTLFTVRRRFLPLLGTGIIPTPTTTTTLRKKYLVHMCYVLTPTALLNGIILVFQRDAIVPLIPPHLPSRCEHKIYQGTYYYT